MGGIQLLSRPERNGCVIPDGRFEGVQEPLRRMRQQHPELQLPQELREADGDFPEQRAKPQHFSNRRDAQRTRAGHRLRSVAMLAYWNVRLRSRPELAG